MRPSMRAILFAACMLQLLAPPTHAAGKADGVLRCDGDPVCEIICNQASFWRLDVICWVKSCAKLCEGVTNPLEILP